MMKKEFIIKYRHISGKGDTEEVRILAHDRKEAMSEFNALLVGKRADYNIVKVNEHRNVTSEYFNAYRR